MMTFSPDTRVLAFKLSNGYCLCSDWCVEKASQLHHKLANTKVNQRLFPLFLHSIFNACPINENCHATKPLPRITEHEAAIYEEYLRTTLKEAL